MRFDLDQAVLVLERTPPVVRALLAGLPLAWTRVNEGGDTWTAFDVVGHLIDGEETDWIPRARIILSDREPRAFAPFDRQRHRRRDPGESLEARLDRFERLRGENVATLRSFRLTAADLARTGIHPEFGTVTLEQLLATWVAHDLDHLVQVARVMARQYGDAVGPWRAYLRVITG
jgi:hypothetical protein